VVRAKVTAAATVVRAVVVKVVVVVAAVVAAVVVVRVTAVRVHDTTRFLNRHCPASSMLVQRFWRDCACSLPSVL